MNIQTRVANGISLLDEKAPKKWRERIDKETLDIGNCEDCILGQIYGDYDRGCKRLFGRDHRIYIREEYGFTSLSDRPHTSELRKEWIKQLGL